jgi:hypothetical protein
MAGWHHEGAFREKECKVCDTPFLPKSGVHKFCSEECKGKWQYISGRLSTENQYKEISGNWRRYFARLCTRSVGRSDLSVEDCLALLEEQDGKCALSGIELTCLLEKGTKFKTNASLDRIEAGGPYIKENVQLVCSVLNKFRVDTPLEEFKWWCKKVADHHG